MYCHMITMFCFIRRSTLHDLHLHYILKLSFFGLVKAILLNLNNIFYCVELQNALLGTPYMLLFFIDKLLMLLVVDAFLIGSFSPT